ncbi:MAG TPA: phosphate ABC transporter permease subunit PstC [Paracoccus sp. (in: a-proteobacteria)]|nr:phosphate ABC transporter permease subunit PstC [Paracoccus sp. (in: a-proteobacteria)]
MAGIAFVLLLLAASAGYLVNRRAALALRDGGQRLHSLGSFHGLYSLLTIAVPAAILILLWLILQGPVIDRLVMGGLPAGTVEAMDGGARQLTLAEIHSIAGGRIFGTPDPWKLDAAARLAELERMSGWLLVASVAALALAMMILARSRVSAAFRARQGVERIVMGILIFCSLVAIFVTVGIVFSLVFESIRFFRMVPITEFLFGTRWEPQIPIRADQVAAEGAFGWLPVLLGTLVITVVAIVIAVPVGLLSAIYLNEFASRRFRAVAKPVLELLAGIPSVVFAILTVAPALRSAGAALGIPVAPNTALAAGSVMAIMLIPFISSFADDALTAVPRSLRDGSLALGATRAETVTKVLFPAAIPGIVGGVLLAISRAIGETMIVVMAAGLIARMTINPLESVTTVTVQIVTLLIGDTEFDSPKTLAAFALGLMLFLVTLAINIVALRIVRSYREQYD